MIRALMAITGMALLVTIAYAAEPAKDKDTVVVKAIDTKDLKLPKKEGKLDKPLVIESEEELAKAVEDKDSREKIQKQVDFKNQKLLYFAWAGSGADKLSHTVQGDKKPEVVFTFKGGITLDYHLHQRLFVVPKDATWKLEK